MGLSGGMAAPDLYSRNVAASVERLRKARHLSLRGLSERLGGGGHPMLPSAVHALVQGKRKVTADDLMALAAVLEVTPADLLACSSDAEAAAASHLAMRAARQLAALIGEVLANPGDPVPARRLDRALTRVRVEVEELLEDAAARTEKAG
jgi:transcriptional regulator with XRE-family HTH domain